MEDAGFQQCLNVHVLMYSFQLRLERLIHTSVVANSKKKKTDAMKLKRDLLKCQR